MLSGRSLVEEAAGDNFQEPCLVVSVQSCHSVDRHCRDVHAYFLSWRQIDGVTRDVMTQLLSIGRDWPDDGSEREFSYLS